jgi:hypothetical protein
VRGTLIAVSVGLAAVACGGGTPTIDHARAEAIVRNLVRGVGGRPMRTISCPSGVRVRPGATFDCRLVTPAGGIATITEHIVDRAGHLRTSAGDLHVITDPSGHRLGTTVRVHNVPGLPRAALELTAQRPLDPGEADDGTTGGAFPADHVYPELIGQDQPTQVRFVDVPVTVENAGAKPVQVMLDGSGTDEHGRNASAIHLADGTWPGPHGRAPDWTARNSPPIAPRTRATRYLTIPVARGSRLAEVTLQAMLLGRGETLTVPDYVPYLVTP